MEDFEYKIYNSLGQEIRTLADKDFTAGSHVVIWDGKDQFGHDLASGTYLYRLKAGSYTASKKMLLTR